jgi:hypothetical protein
MGECELVIDRVGRRGRRGPAKLVVSGLGLAVLGLATLAGGTGSALAGGGPAAGTVTVLAGGVGGPGPATGVASSAPCGVVSVRGHLLFSETGQEALITDNPNDPEISNVVRDVNERTGWLRTMAGTGLPGLQGPSELGGPADLASLGGVCGMAVDHAGNVILAGDPMTGGELGSGALTGDPLVIAAKSGDFYGQRMRAGDLYSLPAATDSSSVAVDYAGNLVLTAPGNFHDQSNASVQVIAARSGTFYGQSMKVGQVYTIASLNRLSIGDVTVDASGNPVVGEGSTVAIAARSGTFDGHKMTAGGSYTLGSRVFGPAAVDRNGNFVMALGSQQVGVLATRSGVFYGRHMRPGHFYPFSKAAEGFAGDGGPVSGAVFRDVSGVTVDGSGNWVLADLGNHRIRVVAVKSGRFYGIAMKAMAVYTVAGNASDGTGSGNGGAAARAELGLDGLNLGTLPSIFDVATDPASDVYLSDPTADQVRIVAGRSGVFFGQRMRAGDIYPFAGTGVRGDSGNGGLATRAEIYAPQGLGIDRVGNVLFADSIGKVRVVAAKSGAFYGISMRAGHIYTIAGGGAKLAANGVKATAASIAPADVTVDGHGNVLITDNSNCGTLWALPTKSGSYYGQQMTAGDLYRLTDDGPSLASGVPALSEALNCALGTTLDRAGNIIVTDVFDDLVRVIAASSGRFYGRHMTAGDIYTIAGGGTRLGSGHLATESAIGYPISVAVDRSGNVIVGVQGVVFASGAAHDGVGNLVQVVATRTGTFYGQRMTAGHLYTIVGGGNGIIPDNRLGTKVELLDTMGVAVEPSGDIVVFESLAGRVLLVRG